MRRSIAVKSFNAVLTGITPLTRDIRLLEIELDSPLRFWAGQYVDLTIPGADVTRSFSMANTPRGANPAELHHQDATPRRVFRAARRRSARSAQRLTAKGPYGTCFRREGQPGPMLLIGGGSGMSPLWSILQDHVESGEQRPIRFFYGARTQADLFYLEEFAALTARLQDFRFIPALSHAEPEDLWTAETGFIHDVVPAPFGLRRWTETLTPIPADRRR